MLDCLAAPGDGAGCVQGPGEEQPTSRSPQPQTQEWAGPQPSSWRYVLRISRFSVTKQAHAMEGDVRRAGVARAWRGRPRLLLFLCLTSVVPGGRCSLAATPLYGRSSRALCSLLAAAAARTAAGRFYHRSYCVTPRACELSIALSICLNGR